MKKCLIGIAVLLLLATGPASADNGTTPMLKMDTTYHFAFGVDFLPMTTFPGIALGSQWAVVWEGTVQGDINGVIRWWVHLNPDWTFGSVGRWELWDCATEEPIICNYGNDELLMMAGYDVFGYVSDTDWEGKGIVTYANEDHAEWYGRRITDGGYVDLCDGIPCGEGWFTIYNRPSNKH